MVNYMVGCCTISQCQSILWSYYEVITKFKNKSFKIRKISLPQSFHLSPNHINNDVKWWFLKTKSYKNHVGWVICYNIYRNIGFFRLQN